MSLKRKFFYRACLAATLFCLLTLYVVSALAQKGGTGARGGSLRPERAVPTPTPTPAPQASPTSSTVNNPPSFISSQPLSQPQATPTPFCDQSKPGQCPWTYRFTYGFLANARPRQAEGTAQKIVGGFQFNVYVARRVFVEVDNDNFVSLKPDTAARSTGFGDTVLIIGGDPLLEIEGSNRPAIYTAYGIKIPTASSSNGIGSGQVDHFVLVGVDRTLGRTYLELNFTEYFAGKDGGGFSKTSNMSGIIERVLGVKKKALFHFEVGGAFATQESNAEMYTLNYLEYAFNNRVSIRAGGRAGITPNVPRAGLYLALRFKGNLKEIFK